MLVSYMYVYIYTLVLFPPCPQTMSVDDFATMLAYLVRVCWSATAGQLHLASISDSHPPSPAQPPTRGHQETTPTSLRERTGSEGEGGGQATQLRAGLCLQQEAGSVSSKVHPHTMQCQNMGVTRLSVCEGPTSHNFLTPHRMQL